jgi:hypothetical protein
MDKKKHKVEKNKGKAERERFYWQMPNRVMKEMALKEGMVVVDFGSGKGYFSLRPGGESEYSRWLPIVAAARLSENIPELEKWLVAQAENGL